MLQVLLWLPCHNFRGGWTGGATLELHTDSDCWSRLHSACMLREGSQ